MHCKSQLSWQRLPIHSVTVVIQYHQFSFSQSLFMYWKPLDEAIVFLVTVDDIKPQYILFDTKSISKIFHHKFSGLNLAIWHIWFFFSRGEMRSIMPFLCLQAPATFTSCGSDHNYKQPSQTLMSGCWDREFSTKKKNYRSVNKPVAKQLEQLKY